MTNETMDWLNNQTLIGFTDKRGNAWHYQETLQGDEPNHYPGAVPMADVERRLFNWEAISIPHTYEFNGVTYTSDRQDIIRSDAPEVLMGVFKDGYTRHQYKEWLLKNVGSILDDELAIGSAGLLQNGAQAWVSVEVPENVTTPEGVEFRPNLVAATSFNGSLATSYNRTVTLPVCDNTLAAGLSEEGQKVRYKHTRNSNLKIASAREALAIVYTIADDFAAEVARLCTIEVSDAVWKKVLTETVPIAEDASVRKTNSAEKKRGELINLYRNDVRVAPWSGTAFGVLQAFNTWNHHVAGTRGQTKVQRNRAAALTNEITNKDAEVMELVEALVAA